MLYEDPNDDGDPSDAILLESVDTVVEDPGTNQFTDTRIAPTRVEGTFFIAAVYRGHPSGVSPAPLDQSSESQQASWVALNGANELDEEDLPSNGLFANLDALGFPGNWLLRANGTSDIVAFSPEQGIVDPGESQDVTVTINAEELPPGEYGGNIRFTNNDPENNPLDVPYDIAIDAGPPQIVLTPRTLEFDDQLVGGTLTETFEITNLGSDTLAVSGIGSGSEDFTALTTSVPELAFEETAEVEVEFTPTETGVRVGTIAIESNAEEKPTAEVAVVGEGLAAPAIAADPESFDVTVPFGEDSTLEETLLVSNTGAGRT